MKPVVGSVSPGPLSVIVVPLIVTVKSAWTEGRNPTRNRQASAQRVAPGPTKWWIMLAVSNGGHAPSKGWRRRGLGLGTAHEVAQWAIPGEKCRSARRARADRRCRGSCRGMAKAQQTWCRKNSDEKVEV